MMHDFSLTEKYVVLYDLPVALDFGTRLSSRPAKAVAALLTRFAERHAAPDFFLRAAMRGSDRGGASPGGMPYRWAPERQARVGVLPREGTAADIRWFEVQPCYVFHPLNAYDEAIASCSTSCGTRRCSPQAIPSSPATRRWTGGPSTSPPARSPRSDSTTRGRNFRASMSDWSAVTTGTATRSVTPRDDGHLSARRDPQARRRHAAHTVRRVRARPRTRRVRLRPVQYGCRRGRRCGDGFRLRPVDRPQRPGAARWADAGNRRDRAPSGPCAAWFSRQLGADRGLASPNEPGHGAGRRVALAVGRVRRRRVRRGRCGAVMLLNHRFPGERARGHHGAGGHRRVYCWRSAAASSAPTNSTGGLWSFWRSGRTVGRRVVGVVRCGRGGTRDLSSGVRDVAATAPRSW